jgi:solute carrier family 25 phosphate transporter 3
MSKLYNWSAYDSSYFLKSAIAGGICCSITHGGVVPIDVVKTKIQLEPTVYNKGMMDAAKTIVKNEGVMGLSTGLAPTALGYFVQGWFKFGGVELCKINFAKSLGDEKAWTMRQPIYLASAALAEFVADIFLCPLEACRIRLVSDPTYASSMPATMAKMAGEEGVVKAFYSGFGPILFKQVPYTMAKFAVQGAAAEKIYNTMGTSPAECSQGKNVSISLGSGVIAGVVAAIISHPADTLLSKINKAGAGGDGGTISRLWNISVETGFVKLCTTGLGARCVMIGTLTAGQFGIFDTVLNVCGAKKFHFHDPAKGGH